MNRFLCAFVALLLAGACDAQNPSAVTAAPTSAKKDDPSPSKSESPGAGAAVDAAPKFSGLSDCLRSCEVADVIPTNRETCRLNCDASYGAQPVVAAPGSDPVGQAASCMGRCYAADTTSEDCATSCKTVAAKASPTAAADVLDRLGTCVRTCHIDKSVLPTNRATCELNCTQTARVAGPGQPAASPSTK